MTKFLSSNMSLLTLVDLTSLLILIRISRKIYLKAELIISFSFAKYVKNNAKTPLHSRMLSKDELSANKNGKLIFLTSLNIENLIDRAFVAVA